MRNAANIAIPTNVIPIQNGKRFFQLKMKSVGLCRYKSRGVYRKTIKLAENEIAKIARSFGLGGKFDINLHIVAISLF